MNDILMTGRLKTDVLASPKDELSVGLMRTPFSINRMSGTPSLGYSPGGSRFLQKTHSLSRKQGACC